MIFVVNNSLFVGCEGKYVMVCKIEECFYFQFQMDVSLCVELIVFFDVWVVFGCGELYLLILIENMCCEGYEF